MAVCFKMKFDTKERKEEARQCIHMALTGSPSYINSEVCLSDLNDTELYLIVGEDNKQNLEIELNI